MKPFLNKLKRLQNFKITFLGIFTTFFLVYFLYAQTYNALSDNNNEKILKIAKLASMHITAEDLNQINWVEDIEKEEFKKVIKEFQIIRNLFPDVNSIYTMRKGKDEWILEFVIDFDYFDKDSNNDWTISEDEEAVLPWEEYNAAEDAPLMLQGFKTPIYEEEAYEDKWWVTRSAYAPIFSKNNNWENYIVWVDVEQDVFQKNITVTKGVSIMIFIVFCLTFINISYLSQKDKYLEIENLKEKKEKEKLSDLNKIKDEFIALASHELRTPLTVVQQYSTFLFDMINDEKTKKYLKKISKNCRKVLNMANDMIDISKIDNSKISYELKDIDFVEKLEKFLKNDYLQEEIQEKNITIVKKYDESKKLFVKAGEAGIEKIFHHLIENAVKFNKPNWEIILTINEDNKRLIFSVKDNGLGMKKEKIPHIFDKFQQNDEVMTRDYEGLWLGLTIVQKLVHEFWGFITVESELGKGSKFTLSFNKNS